MLFSDIILVYSLPDATLGAKKNLIGTFLASKNKKAENKGNFEFIINVADLEVVQVVDDGMGPE